MDEIKVQLARKIKHAMVDKDINSSQLATIVGVTYPSIRSLLKGEHNIAIDTLIAIEKALEIELINIRFSISDRDIR